VACVKTYVVANAKGETFTHVLVSGDNDAAQTSLIELGKTAERIVDMTRPPTLLS
jgi:hypothetical protein